MQVPITLDIPEFRPAQTNMRGIARALVDNMSGEIESGIIEAGQAEEAFSNSILVIDGVEISSDNLADRNQILQNKSGVIALLDDAYGIRDTVILPEGLVSVDWDKGKNFVVTLSGNRQSAFYMAHAKAGMEINLWLVNNGTNQTVGTWDSAIKWPANTAPTMPAATVGSAALMLVKIRDINSILYGEYLNYSASSAGLGTSGGGGGISGHGGGDLVL